MPKLGRRQTKLTKWCSDIEEKCFNIDGAELYCTLCEKKVTCSRKSQLRQHISTQVHKNKANNSMVPNNTSTNSNSSESRFEYDLCQALVGANIPWKALNNEAFNSFLKKYTKRNIPDESTMRKSFLDKCYQQKVEEIRNDIKNEYVWLSVDETTDRSGRYIANLIIGKLSETEGTSSHLLACKQLEHVNNCTISRFVNDGLRLLWPNGNENQVLLLVTDAAAYMLKAGRNLKVFYPNMVHLTCLAHGLNRVAESIRMAFPEVNSFISSVKKIFLKAPYRVAIYKNVLGIELPPEPIITRWGTWIKAAAFYANNFEGIKQVVQSFNPDDATSIKSAQDILKNPELFRQLIFIKSNFERLPILITSLEGKSMSLKDSFKIFQEAENIIKGIPGDLGVKLQEKLSLVLRKNPDFDSILKVHQLLNCNSENNSEIDNIAREHIVKYKYAPLTSCDVERSFSAYKMIFSEKRQNLTVENLEKIIVVYCSINYHNHNR